MTRLPCPSSAALFVPDVYHSRSWLLALSPVSNCHLPVSTPDPAGPSKSSVKLAAEGVATAAVAGKAADELTSAVANRAARHARVRSRCERRRVGVTVMVTSQILVCDAPS